MDADQSALILQERGMKELQREETTDLLRLEGNQPGTGILPGASLRSLTLALLACILAASFQGVCSLVLSDWLIPAPGA